MYQGQLKFYVVIINPKLIRIFVKPFMKGSKLKNKANRTKLQDDIAKYKKH